MIAVRAINNHTPSGEGSGGRFLFRFRRGLLMIVVGRNVSPPGGVCMCVFMFLFWFVGECVEIVNVLVRFFPSFGGRLRRRG